MKNKYSFQEIDNEIRDSSLRISQVFDERNKMRDNWKYLKEWIEDLYNKGYDIKIVLDKMNELEGKDK